MSVPGEPPIMPPNRRFSGALPPERQDEALQVLRAWLAEPPEVFLVLGSGLGAFASRIAGPIDFPFGRVPGLEGPTVAGHAGRFVSGRVEDTAVLVQAGRLHCYEGHHPWRVGWPVRLAAALGARAAILTNSSGSLRADITPGSIAVLRDVLDLQTIHVGGAGAGGPRDGTAPGDGAPRGPAPRSRRSSGTSADTPMEDAAVETAKELGMRLHGAVYAGVLGPSYETRAEVRMLRRLGADLVGMSTVPEIHAARGVGLPCVTLSFVSNLASGFGGAALSHRDVLKVAAEGTPRLERLLRGLVRRLGEAS